MTDCGDVCEDERLGQSDGLVVPVMSDDGEYPDPLLELWCLVVVGMIGFAKAKVKSSFLAKSAVIDPPRSLAISAFKASFSLVAC